MPCIVKLSSVKIRFYEYFASHDCITFACIILIYVVSMMCGSHVSPDAGSTQDFPVSAGCVGVLPLIQIMFQHGIDINQINALKNHGSFCGSSSTCNLFFFPVKLPYRVCIPLCGAWTSNHIHYKVWGEITYPFPNFNGAAVEVWEWKSNFIPHFTRHVITYPCWD